MIVREKYLSEIRPFYDSDLIKIITGVRRCGKSIILEQINTEISKKSTNIIYLDFEDRAVTSNLTSWQDIVDYIDNNRDTNELCHVFLDEIQTIDNWSIACKTLRKHNYLLPDPIPNYYLVNSLKNYRVAMSHFIFVHLYIENYMNMEKN